MNITQISSVVANNSVVTIYGLGDDGLVYKWDYYKSVWELYVIPQAVDSSDDDEASSYGPKVSFI